MITSKEVAKAANVSISTVSRVFSNPKLVNTETIKKVKEIAAQLNYFPDITAKSLKLNVTNIIGVVLSDINNPFYLHILKQMSTIEAISNYRFFVVFSEEREKIEYDCITSLIASKVDALIFTPTGSHNTKIESMISDNNVAPLQLYRRNYENFDSLTIDDEYGAYLATKELLNNGHRKIILVDYKLAIPTNRDKGYIKAFEEANIPYDSKWIIQLDINANYEHELFDILDQLNPTAIIPASYIFANSIFTYLKLRNKKVKDDISLIIYDDNSIAEHLNISVIAHPLSEIAQTTAETIKRRLDNPNIAPQHLVIKPFFLQRDSIKKLI